MNLSEAVIDHALSIEWDVVPTSARRSVRTLLHDTLCVGVAGACAPGADAVAAAVAGWGEGGACGVLGRPGMRLPAPQAAFLNAFQIHAQEFDAVHEGAVLHPFSATVAALLAEIDRGGASAGADVLAALTAGVDIAAGLGAAANAPLRFFRPATAGIFGAVAAMARLRRLDRQTLRNAFGHALAFASGSMQAHVEGTAALPVQVANAARGAVAAVDIAQAGIVGPSRFIDGDFGYFAQFETSHDAHALRAGLEGPRRVEECSIKPFPTGRAAHGGIFATQVLLRDHGLVPDRLVRLSYTAPALIARLVGRPAVDGMSVAYARLCLPWLVATTLQTGGVALGDFSAQRLADPQRLALASRIAVEDDGSGGGGAFTPALATAELTDGRILRVEVKDLPGSPHSPLSEDDRLAKAAACLEFAGFAPLHAAVCDSMATLDASPDIAGLLALVYGDRPYADLQ